MKYIILILTLFAVNTEANINAGDGPSTESISITHLLVPKNLDSNDRVMLGAEVELPTTCHRFAGYDWEITENDGNRQLFIEAKAWREKGNCIQQKRKENVLIGLDSLPVGDHDIFAYNGEYLNSITIERISQEPPPIRVSDVTVKSQGGNSEITLTGTALSRCGNITSTKVFIYEDVIEISPVSEFSRECSWRGADFTVEKTVSVDLLPGTYLIQVDTGRSAKYSELIEIK